MMRNFIVLTALLVFPLSASAQSVFFRSSTLEEGVLRGRGALAQGQGQYLSHLGDYEQRHQDAIRQAIDNWQSNVIARWQIRDAYQERVKTPNYLEVWEQRIKNRERFLGLLSLEQQHKDTFYLPTAKAVIRGREYARYEDWTKTLDHYLHKLELKEKRLMSLLSEAIGEKQHSDAVASAAWDDRLGADADRYYRERRMSIYRNSEKRPDKPKHDTTQIDIKLDATSNVLNEVRKDIERVKAYMKAHGNVQLSQLTQVEPK